MSGASAALVRLDLEVDLESLSPEALLEWAQQARTELTVHRRRISASRRSTLSHDVQGVAHGRRSSIDELEELQLLALRAETEGHWRTCSFARLPIQISGIALNICGIAALLRNVGILYPGLGRWVNHLVLPLYVESLLLQVLCFVRLGAVRPFWSDFKSLRHTSALGALLIAIQLAWAEMAVALATEEGDAGDFQGLGLSERGAQAAAAVSSGAAVVQTVVALYFLAQCVRRAAPVDCFWFPATVSLATPALTCAPPTRIEPMAIHVPCLPESYAPSLRIHLRQSQEPGVWARWRDAQPLLGGCRRYPKLHQPQWVLYTTLSAGVLVAVLLWPPCLWRVLRSPREVAPNAAVFVLMAPVAFVTMGVFNAGGEALIGPDGARSAAAHACVRAPTSPMRARVRAHESDARAYAHGPDAHLCCRRPFAHTRSSSLPFLPSFRAPCMRSCMRPTPQACAPSSPSTSPTSRQSSLPPSSAGARCWRRSVHSLPCGRRSHSRSSRIAPSPSSLPPPGRWTAAMALPRTEEEEAMVLAMPLAVGVLAVATITWWWAATAAGRRWRRGGPQA